MDLRKGSLQCDCNLCRQRDLQLFFEGSVQTVLFRAKTHDHLAQRDELSSSRDRIRKGEYISLLKEKEYPRKFLPTFQKIISSEAAGDSSLVNLN